MGPGRDFKPSIQNSKTVQDILSNLESFSTTRKDAVSSNRYETFKDVSLDILRRVSSQLAASYTGIPQVSPILDNILSKDASYSLVRYSTSPYNQLNNIPGLAYNDFRSRKSKIGLGTSLDVRLDGLGASFSAAAISLNTTVSTLKNFKGAIYAAASAAPGGVYNVFNINSVGKFGYGWGDHGNPNALRFDFTLRSHVYSGWDYEGKKWVTGTDPLKKLIPFRGDRVSVIDAGKRHLKDAYRWNSPILNGNGKTNLRKKIVNFLNDAGETNDFIKFYFTGPKLSPNTRHESDKNTIDDIIVFRATIDSVGDTFSPQWSPYSLIGRADQNYHYTSFSREVSLDFTIYATDRDELKPIYRKLNALAGYTTPDYSAQNSIGLIGPWLRITIGDLFNQVPAVISSLNYTFGDQDSPWEINIEDDPENMQVPHKIAVSISFSIISEWLPEKGGQFYSLSKRFDEYGSRPGNDNWLSDTVTVNKRPLTKEEYERIDKQQNKKNGKEKNPNGGGRKKEKNPAGK